MATTSASCCSHHPTASMSYTPGAEEHGPDQCRLLRHPRTSEWHCSDNNQSLPQLMTARSTRNGPVGNDHHRCGNKIQHHPIDKTIGDVCRGLPTSVEVCPARSIAECWVLPLICAVIPPGPFGKRVGTTAEARQASNATVRVSMYSR